MTNGLKCAPESTRELPSAPAKMPSESHVGGLGWGLDVTAADLRFISHHPNFTL
jgi:hypothetical protein